MTVDEWNNMDKSNPPPTSMRPPRATRWIRKMIKVKGLTRDEFEQTTFYQGMKSFEESLKELQQALEPLADQLRKELEEDAPAET